MLSDEEGCNACASHGDETRRRKAEQVRIRRNKKRGLQFEEDMFAESSRYLVLHITLNYKKRYREDISLRSIQAHRNRFIRHMDEYGDRLLQGVRGLIWKLEEGNNSGGLHLHFLVFYRGDCRADVLIAKLLGEYWETVITKGYGDYWNSNACKAAYERKWGIGVGQVNRRGDTKRDSLRLFIENYMAKSDQIPQERTMDDKLFGTRNFNR